MAAAFEGVSELRRRRRKNVSHAGEAQYLREQGADVVIGYFEPHKRADTIEKRRSGNGSPEKSGIPGTAFEEMDTEAILLDRQPVSCREFAHTNVPVPRDASDGKKYWRCSKRASMSDDDEPPALKPE